MKKGQRLLCSDAFISTSNDKLFYKILSVQNSVDNNMDCQWNYTKHIKRGIEPFIISFIIMLMPYIVQAIIKGLDGLDDRWRVKQCLEKERKREIFKSI